MPVSSSEEESTAEMLAAQQAMDRAYWGSVGINIFDTKAGELMRATARFVHTVVKAERGRVRDLYENSGIRETSDLDALDRVVDLTDPERLFK